MNASNAVAVKLDADDDRDLDLEIKAWIEAEEKDLKRRQLESKLRFHVEMRKRADEILESSD